MSVRVEVLTPARYRENYDIEHAFLGSKKFCCVLPWSCCGGFGEWRAQREKQAPEHKALYAVAIDESTSKVLGFVHCCGHGMKCDLHTPKAGELYVEELAVSADARGKGVGTPAASARRRGCSPVATQARSFSSGPRRKRSRAATRSCRWPYYGATGRRGCISGSASRSNPTRTAATSAASAAS